MKYLRYVCCVVWIGIIFFNSSFSATSSNEMSMDIVEQLTETGDDSNVELGENESTLLNQESLNLLLRKVAHFVQYFVLASLMFWVFSGTQSLVFREVIIYTLFGVLLVAVSDEFLQSFTQRSPRVEDVVLDFVGGSSAVACWSLIRFLSRKHVDY